MATILDYASTHIAPGKTIGDLWATRPVFLVFLRRLGCAICRAYVEEIKEHMEEITEYADVVFFSFETPGTGSDEDRSFSLVWSGPIYVIPKHIYKNLFGKKRFFDGLFGLADMDTTLVKKHKTTGNLKGDGFVLGGQCLVSPQGILLDHRQTRYGDDVPVEKLMKILKAF